MNSRRSSIADKKGGFKLLDIAHGTVPEDIQQTLEKVIETNTTKVSDEDTSEKKTDYTEENGSKLNEDENKTNEDNSEEAPIKATKEDCLKLLRESFDGYDYNGNGTVAHEEVREAWIMCQEEWNEPCDPDRCNLEATIFMKDIDKDGDDQVDFEEYVKYFRHLWLLSQGHEMSEVPEQ